jgi:hypothetical protein
MRSILARVKSLPLNNQSLLTPSPFDADQGLDLRHLARKLRFIRGIDDRGHVLVRSRSFLRDAAGRGAADNNALAGQMINHLAPAPLFTRLITAHLAAGVMTGSAEGVCLTLPGAELNIFPFFSMWRS